MSILKNSNHFYFLKKLDPHELREYSYNFSVKLTERTKTSRGLRTPSKIKFSAEEVDEINAVMGAMRDKINDLLAVNNKLEYESLRKSEIKEDVRVKATEQIVDDILERLDDLEYAMGEREEEIFSLIGETDEVRDKISDVEDDLSSDLATLEETVFDLAEKVSKKK
jgi:molecular chaperone GrpE (heat shock protein)